jgi:hypothetical protein
MFCARLLKERAVAVCTLFRQRQFSHLPSVYEIGARETWMFFWPTRTRVDAGIACMTAPSPQLTAWEQ